MKGGIIALALLAAAAGNAAAGYYGVSTGCSMSAGTFASVTIGNLAHAPDIVVPFRMECNTDPNLVKLYVDKVFTDGHPRGVGYCFHIHNDYEPIFNYRDAVQKASPRYPNSYPAVVTSPGLVMPVPYYPFILFNFYADNGTRKVAAIDGSHLDQYNIMGWATRISDSKYSVVDSIVLRFEGNEGRQITTGDYSWISTGAAGATPIHGGISAVVKDVPMDWDHPSTFCKATDQDDGGDKAIGMPGAVYAPINIQISVRTYCTMTVPTHATFPVYASLRDVKPIAADLNVDCSAGTHYRVTSNMGLHAVGNQRYMKAENGDDTIAYNIDSITTSSADYQPESFTSWTDYGNGTPAGIDYHIQFSIPQQPTPPDGTYKDTIIYTLNHIPESGDISDLNNMAGYTVR